jgi:hypothetical protein
MTSPRLRLYRRLGHEAELLGGFAGINAECATRLAVHLGLYPIVTFQCSTTTFTRFPIIFGSCFSKVTIGYKPRRTSAAPRRRRTTPLGPARRRRRGGWRRPTPSSSPSSRGCAPSSPRASSAATRRRRRPTCRSWTGRRPRQTRAGEQLRACPRCHPAGGHSQHIASGGARADPAGAPRPSGLARHDLHRWLHLRLR